MIKHHEEHPEYGEVGIFAGYGEYDYKPLAIPSNYKPFNHPDFWDGVTPTPYRPSLTFTHSCGFAGLILAIALFFDWLFI